MITRSFIKFSRCFSGVTILTPSVPKLKPRKVPNFSYQVGPIKREDIAGIVEISRENNFQFPEPSLWFWLEHDPDGIQVARTNSGQVIGVCGTVKNNDNLYFGGMFSVQSKYRDSDVGRMLMHVCNEHAGPHNIGVNCAASKVDTFKRRGVSLEETNWTSLEYEIYNPVQETVLSDRAPQGVEVQPYQEVLFDAMCAYDLSLIGYDRRSTLRASCCGSDCRTMVATKDGRCVGIGSVRPNIMDIHRVGPLYADDPAVAEVLLRKLVEGVRDIRGLSFVTVSSNAVANSFATRLGIPVNDTIYRLYRKKKLEVDTGRVYAHLDLDFTPF